MQHKRGTQLLNLTKLIRSHLLSTYSLRPFNTADCNSCRKMNGDTINANDFNPGIRVEQSFISDEQVRDLLLEVEELKNVYGFKSQDTLYLNSTDINNNIENKNETKSNLAVDSYRITGRSESKHQTRAPWKYAEEFELDKLPNSLRSIAQKITESSIFKFPDNSKLSNGLKLPLRDITINFRSNSMFRLDPHIDPLLDGSNVFILNLLSDSVVTFTPDLTTSYSKNLKRTSNIPLKIRTDEAAISLKSWTDDDIDVFVKPKDLLHFTDDARYLWKHAIRTGIEVSLEQPQQESINNPTSNKKELVYKVCDWWGDLNHLSIRNSDRISIVFAFL